MTSDRRREVAPRRAADAPDPTGRSALREAWLKENRAAIELSNAWVEQHGLPLAEYRRF